MREALQGAFMAIGTPFVGFLALGAYKNGKIAALAAIAILWVVAGSLVFMPTTTTESISTTVASWWDVAVHNKWTS